MDMKIIHTDKAPAAVGPYSQATEVNGLIYTSGQILCAVLEAAGTSPEKAVKTLCFLTDIGDFAAFNEVYTKYFTGKPARSCVGISALPKGAKCEVEVIAEK